MTAPLPETAGAMEGTPAEKYAAQDTGESPEILADLPDLSGMAQDAQSEGHAWCAEAGQMLDSGAGFGLDGYQVTGDTPAGAAHGHWPLDMMFPHEGPP